MKTVLHDLSELKSEKKKKKKQKIPVAKGEWSKDSFHHNHVKRLPSKALDHHNDRKFRECLEELEHWYDRNNLPPMVSCLQEGILGFRYRELEIQIIRVRGFYPKFRVLRNESPIGSYLFLTKIQLFSTIYSNILVNLPSEEWKNWVRENRVKEDQS